MAGGEGEIDYTRRERTFWYDVNVLYLIRMVATRYTFVKTHQTILLKSVNYISIKLIKEGRSLGP